MDSTPNVESLPISGAPEPGLHPRPPIDIEQTGLPFFFLVELAAKILFKGGSLRQSELVDRLKLLPGVLEPLLAFMRAERLIEVQPRIQGDPLHLSGKDFTFSLTDLGRERAAQYMMRSQYAGPAPVSLDAYVRQVGHQSVADLQVTRDGIRKVFQGVVLKPELLDQFGAAMNSGAQSSSTARPARARPSSPSAWSA
jgi:DNA-binding PadR family transcriptional regulator